MSAILGLLLSKATLLSILGGIAGPFAGVVGSFFTKSRPTIYLCLACTLLGGAGGWYVTLKFWQASEKAAVEAAMAFQQVKFHTVTKVEEKVVTKIQVVREKGKEVIKYVPKIITKKVEAACPSGLPNGFVRVHDAAAANEPNLLSGGPSESDANPSGVTLTEAGEVISDNYTEYHVCKAQVEGWNEFYGCLRSSTSKLGVDSCVSEVADRMKAIKALFNRE